MKNLNEIKKKILRSRSIAVICHINPDGDCIGSLLALGIGLTKLKKRISMISQDGVPIRYKNLPGKEKIKRSINKIPDMAITVDCNASEMLGKPFNIIKKSKYILEIDHHEYRQPFGNLFFIDTKAAAVGEMVYELLTYMNIPVDKDIAQNILTSIIVETNAFRLPSVRPSTFYICDKLLRTGVNYHELSELIYWSKTRQAVLLFGICISKLIFAEHGKIAWSAVSRKDFSKVKGKDEDVDAVASDILAIKDVEIAILFREKSKGILRVSLRSKGRMNVASVAYKYGGGGHFDSAGCRIADKRTVIRALVEDARKLLTQKNRPAKRLP